MLTDKPLSNAVTEWWLYPKAHSRGKQGSRSGQGKPGCEEVIAKQLTFLTPITTVLERRRSQKGIVSAPQHTKESQICSKWGTPPLPNRSKCSDYRSRKIPLQKEDSKSPVQLKGQNFLHLRVSLMNKPVKQGLDLLNMKTTGLKYNLGRKERKCTKKAK